MKLLSQVLAVCCLVASVGTSAEDFTAEERIKVETLVQQLNDADASKRAAAETQLRELGPKIVPALITAKVEQEDGQVRLRSILVDLLVKGSKVDEKDARTLGLIAKEEAVAKRYGNAHKAYERCEKVFDNLRSDAKNKKDKDKEKEFDKHKDRAGELKRKAERLSAGQSHKVSNWGPIPTIKKVEDDGDWEL